MATVPEIVSKYDAGRNYLADLIKKDFDSLRSVGKTCNSQSFIDCLFLTVYCLRRQIELEVFDCNTDILFQKLSLYIPEDYEYENPDADVVQPDGEVPLNRTVGIRFIELIDAPLSYIGQGGKVVFVKADESGLEFKEVQSVLDTFALGTDLQAEASFRILADNELQSNIDDEATIRANAISAINTLITQEVSDLNTDLSFKVDKVVGKSLLADTEIARLLGMATGATANQTDAWLVARENHTGVQAISTITGLQTALDARGDMFKSVYDPNNDGVVNDSERLGSIVAGNYALKSYVDGAINNLVNGSPALLDTLNEFAQALGNDPNFATTVTNSIATKEPIIVAGTISQYWKGDKTWATLNTQVVAEHSSALYYTDARVQTYGDAHYSLLAHTHTFASLTSKPTTLDGFGITGGVLTGQLILKESSGSTDYTKGLRFGNDPFAGGQDVSGLRLYASSGENQVLELYVGNDPTDTINFRTGVGNSTPSNDGVTINGNIILNAANYTNYALASTVLSGGTGFVKSTAGTISYDTSTYLTTGAAATTYQLLENQRLSTGYDVAFNKVTIGATVLQLGTGASDGAYIYFNGASTRSINSTGGALQFTGFTSFNANTAITGSSFIKSGGTYSQFLMADGTTNSTVYATDSLAVHLAGTETITGAKTFSVPSSTEAISVTSFRNTGTLTYPGIGSFLAPNTVSSSSAGTGPFFSFGVAESNYNAGNLQFNYRGAGSTSNTVSIGIYGFAAPLAISSTSVTLAGNLLFTDATYDIGGSSTTFRPRHYNGSGNIYTAGTLTVTGNSNFSDNIAIGSGAATFYSLLINKSATGGTTIRGIYVNSAIQSGVTSSYRTFESNISTAAASFTVGSINHFVANPNSFGAGSTVTEQNGFSAEANITGATSNYGFRGKIPSATGRWNLYMDGTATNYLNGNLQIGTPTVTAGAEKLQVTGTASISSTLLLGGLLTGTTATFSGQINSTVNGSAFLRNVTTGTGVTQIYMQNGPSANGAGSIQLENSTASSGFSGSLAYAMLIGTSVTQPLQFATNTSVRYTISSTGDNTWTGAGTFGGALTGTSASFTSGLRLDNTSAENPLYFWSDSNWKMSMAVTAPFTKANLYSHTINIAYFNQPGQGLAFGVNGGNSSFELNAGDHSAWFRGSITATAGTFGGILRPGADNTYTLGTSSLRWSTVYGISGVFSNITTSGDVNVGGNLIPTGVAFIPSAIVSGSMISLWGNTNADSGVRSISAANLKAWAGYYTSGDNVSLVTGTFNGIVKATTFKNIVDVSTNSTFGLYYDQAGSTDYAIYRESGVWTPTYPALRIAFATGIKLGSNTGYGGTRFYNGSDMVTELMSVGNGDNHVRVANNLIATGNVQAAKLGIGVSPSYYLDVDATVSNAISRMWNRSSTGYGLAVSAGNSTNYALTITDYTDGSAKFLVYGDGRLSTSSSATFTGGITATTGVFTSNVSASTGYFYSANSGANNYLMLYPSATQFGGVSAMSASNLWALGYSAAQSTLITPAFTWNSNGVLAISTTPTTSAGTYDVLTRNTSTGVIEKLGSLPYVPYTGATSDLNLGTRNITSGLIDTSNDIRLTYSNPKIQLINSGYSNKNWLLYNNAGNFQVFENAVGAALSIAAGGAVTLSNLGTGTVYSNAGLLTNTNPSDLKLKNSIKPLSYGLAEILKLQPKTFYYNSDSEKTNLKYGFIAQEVDPIMPDVVRKLQGSDKLGLETDAIYVTLVKAIQEQQVIIEELKRDLKELKQV